MTYYSDYKFYVDSNLMSYLNVFINHLFVNRETYEDPNERVHFVLLTWANTFMIACYSFLNDINWK